MDLDAAINAACRDLFEVITDELTQDDFTSTD